MTMLNEHLEHQVNQLLLANEELSSQRIGVTANDGDVTLSGKVQSFRRKLAAQQVAETFEHVRSVDNQIVVSSPDTCNDLQITNEVINRFDSAIGLVSESIRISTKGQNVSLTGYVNTELDKVKASDIAAGVDGVVEISDFLIINADRVTANKQHSEKIHESMAKIIGMEHESIRVSVVDETARLSGQVDAAWKREKAETVTRQFGILHIANEVVVRPEE